MKSPELFSILWPTDTLQPLCYSIRRKFRFPHDVCMVRVRGFFFQVNEPRQVTRVRHHITKCKCIRGNNEGMVSVHRRFSSNFSDESDVTVGRNSYMDE